MVDIVIRDVSYYFPSEMVQGAYGALKALGFDLGETNVSLPMELLTGDDIVTMEDRTHPVDIAILCNDFVFRHIRRTSSRTKLDPYAMFLLQGICGVYNVLGRPIKPFIHDSTGLKVGITPSPEIFNYLPERSQAKNSVTFAKIFPSDVIDLIAQQADTKTKVAMREAMHDVIALNKIEQDIFTSIKVKDFDRLLKIAAKTGDESLFDYALENHYVFDFDESLEIAMSHGHLNIVKRIERMDKGSEGYFYSACMHGGEGVIEIIKHYTPRKADGSLATEKYSVGIRKAAETKHSETLRYLLTIHKPPRNEINLSQVYYNDFIETFKVVFETYEYTTEDILRMMVTAEHQNAEKIREYLRVKLSEI
jgi:hypothetical protein